MIIDNIEKLKELSKNGVECYIRLVGGFRSSKYIFYNEAKKRFEIINYIDDTKQSLTEKQLMDSQYTNIGVAMQFNALIKD
jgi:uncharacterized protein YaaR (DUF327 family)